MKDTILKYFGDELSPDQIDKFDKMMSVYKSWNDKINVVSRKDIDNLYLKHILHSLAIAKVHSFVKGEVVMDLGCGGGFPGIPLAVMFPEVQFKMVDSVGKKILVVKNVALELGLSNVETYNIRAEQIDFKVDYVVSRAVTDLSTFLNWSWKKIIGGAPHGVLYLKGGELDEEISDAKSVVKHSGVITLHSIDKYFDE
ncbi:MAG: 16S rRNA (guanine(527)-N(7))-methyltransferase RsmG, partial [Rikenellaceae bacterium]